MCVRTGQSSWVWGIPDSISPWVIPGYMGHSRSSWVRAFQTQSRFISTQAGDAGWRSGGVYTGAFVPFIPLACRVGCHLCVRVGSSCGNRVSCAGGVLFSAGVAPGERFPFAPHPAPGPAVPPPPPSLPSSAPPLAPDRRVITGERVGGLLRTTATTTPAYNERF